MTSDKFDSRDSEGRYCGMRESDGEFQKMDPDKVGFCGPKCSHCAPDPFYSLENGVWVCVVDSSYMEGD